MLITKVLNRRFVVVKAGTTYIITWLLFFAYSQLVLSNSSNTTPSRYIILEVLIKQIIVYHFKCNCVLKISQFWENIKLLDNFSFRELKCFFQLSLSSKTISMYFILSLCSIRKPLMFTLNKINNVLKF